MESTDASKITTFLITGGGGYIGFHIGLRLVQLKKNVILYDVHYPSEKWGSSIVQSSTINGTFNAQIASSHGEMKFILGKSNIRYVITTLEIDF